MCWTSISVLTCWNIGRFVLAGQLYVNAAQAPKGLPILADNTGYDGQFFYRLTLNPSDLHNTAFGITLDTACPIIARCQGSRVSRSGSWGSLPMAVG